MRVLRRRRALRGRAPRGHRRLRARAGARAAARADPRGPRRGGPQRLTPASSSRGAASLHRAPRSTLAVSGGPDSCGLALLAAAAGCRGDAAPRRPRPAGARAEAEADARRGARRAARDAASSRTPSTSARARTSRLGPAPRAAPRCHAARSPATRWTTRPRPCCSTCCAARGSTGSPRWRPRPSRCSALRRREVREHGRRRGRRDRCGPLELRPLAAAQPPSRARAARAQRASRCATSSRCSRGRRRSCRDDARRTSTTSRGRSCPTPLDVVALRGAPAVLRRRRLRDLARGTDDAAHPPSAAEVDRMEAVVLGRGRRDRARRRTAAHVGAAGAFASEDPEPVRSRG